MKFATRGALVRIPIYCAIAIIAVAFFLSDLTVARDRFVAREAVNRLVGLPLYYTGQFAIAWSVGGMF